MQIILLDEARFDNFAINHPNYNFYQSSYYGKFMSKNGHNSYYLGLVDDNGDIKAATLVVVKSESKDKRKLGYAPRGFLIDWNDDGLVKEFTEQIKEFLSKRGFTYLKVDPMLILKEHNFDGSEKLNGISNTKFVKKMQELGYIHMGYNNGFEASKPRWNSITKLDRNITALYNSISKSARDKITEAFNLGFKVYKGEKEDIEALYKLIDNPNPPIEYYLDYYQFFSEIQGFEIYFARLEPAEFVNSSKKQFEEEEEFNNQLNYQIQDLSVSNKEFIINQKLESDEKLSRYKRNMIDAIALFQKNPNGIMVAGVAIIKYGKKVSFLTSGVDKEYMNQYPEYLLRWHLMQEFSNQGYDFVDFNGIMGNFSDSYGSLIERELGNSIVEYVGEFDLVLNKKSYYTGNKLNPILEWLNKPI